MLQACGDAAETRGFEAKERGPVTGLRRKSGGGGGGVNICANTQRAKTASDAAVSAASAAGAPAVSIAGIGLSNAK